MKKHKKVWLIEWCSTNNSPSPTGNDFIGIYDGRVDYRFIAKLIEFYYATFNYTKSEMSCSFCGNAKKTIYPALIGNYVGKMSCGNNPFISARLVENIVIDGDNINYDEISIN